MKNVIFMGGIHGVGKGFAAKIIADQIPSLNHVTASHLISSHLQKNQNKDKRVKNVKSNQNVLISATCEQLKTDRLYLLDGHFCLINKEDDVEVISVEVFKRLNLMCCIVMYHDPLVIKKRLSDRDGRNYELDLIKKFQEKEILHAKSVAKSVGGPLLVHDNSKSHQELISFIDQQLKINS